MASKNMIRVKISLKMILSHFSVLFFSVRTVSCAAFLRLFFKEMTQET